MPRPRLPTAVLELRGTFKRNPRRKRARADEPIVHTPLPDPPARLEPGAADIWREMKARGYWLTGADKFLVEIAAYIAASFRRDELTYAYTSVLIALLGKLGFSPRERGALNLPTRTT